MEIAALIIALIIGVGLFAIMSKGAGKTGGGKRGSLDRAFVSQRWSQIQTMAITPGGGKNAVLEADKLFDYVLKGKGFGGDTMGERLKRAGSKLGDRDGVWRAHKLRNMLAHEIGFEIVNSQVRDALASFEKGMKDLGAL